MVGIITVAALMTVMTIHHLHNTIITLVTFVFDAVINTVAVVVLQMYQAATAASQSAREALQAAKAELQQPCFLQQHYWCDGAGASAAALQAWAESGLPFRAVMFLKSPAGGEQTKEALPLVTGVAASRSCAC